MPRKEKAPKSIPRVAKAAAPEETPRMNGSARLLRTSACMVTPHTAREAPTTKPRQTRGNRRLRMMFWSSSVQSCGIREPIRGILLNRIFAVVPGATETGPSPVASSSVTAAAARSPIRMAGIFGSPALRRFFFFMEVLLSFRPGGPDFFRTLSLEKERGKPPRGIFLQKKHKKIRIPKDSDGWWTI